MKYSNYIFNHIMTVYALYNAVMSVNVFNESYYKVL